MADLSPEILEALSYLAQIKQEPICPKCGKRPQDERSTNGWCARCDADRDRMLESKRRWWRDNGAQRRREASSSGRS